MLGSLGLDSYMAGHATRKGVRKGRGNTIGR